MSGANIQAAFNITYADGPSTEPDQPNKAEIRTVVGGTLAAEIDAILDSIEDIAAVTAVGVQWKSPVSLATTANITLSGEQTIDGVLTNSTRILVKNQTSAQQNGIYVTAPGAWTRAADADAASEVLGMAVFVTGGTENGGKQFVGTAPAPITVGTTALPFQLISDQSALNATLASKADQAELDAEKARVDVTYGGRVADVSFDGGEVEAKNTWVSILTDTTSILGWSVGFAVTDAAIPDQLRFQVLAAATATQLTFTMWRRPLSVGDGGVTPIMFGAHAQDVLVIPDTNIPLVSSLAPDKLSEVALDLEALGLHLLLPNFIYGWTVSAKNGSTPVVLGVGRGPDFGSADPKWQRGFFTINGTTWSSYAGVGSIAYTLSVKTSSDLETVAQNVAASRLTDGTDTLRGGNAYSGTNRDIFTFCAFSIGAIVPYRGKLRSRMQMQTSGATHVRQRIYRRPLSDAASTSVFGAGSNDVLLQDRTKLLSELVLTDGIMGTVEQDHSDLGIIDTGYIIGFRWEAFGADGGLAFMAVGNGPSIAGAPLYRRGWYSTNGSAYGGFADPASFSFEVLIDVPANQGSAREVVFSDISAMPLSRRRVLDVPACSIWRPSGTLDIPAQQITLDNITSTSGVAGSLTLAASGVSVPSGYQYFGTMVVTRSSDSAVLVENTDYSAAREAGKIYRLSGGADFAASVSFTGYTHRYDLIYADAYTGALGIAKGTNRIVDPEMYKPALPTGKIALYEAYVWRDGVDLLPIHKTRKGVRRDHLDSFYEQLEINRQRIRRTLARADQGLAITMLANGDSTTAVGSGGVLTPGGTARDIVGHFSESGGGGRYPADTIATIPKFDLDGTPNPSGLYCHVGYNWRLKEALARKGSVVTYLNYGWSGTTSADTFTDRPNGLYPDRMAPMLASGAHIASIGYGLNELGSLTTEANIVNMATQYKDAGMDVIIFGPMAINYYNRNGLTVENWLLTHDALARAAEATDSAFVSSHHFFGPGNEVNSGLSRKNMANANLINHDGPYAYAVYGAYLTMMVE